MLVLGIRSHGTLWYKPLEHEIIQDMAQIHLGNYGPQRDCRDDDMFPYLIGPSNEAPTGSYHLPHSFFSYFIKTPNS